MSWAGKEEQYLTHLTGTEWIGGTSAKRERKARQKKQLEANQRFVGEKKAGDFPLKVKALSSSVQKKSGVSGGTTQKLSPGKRRHKKEGKRGGKQRAPTWLFPGESMQSFLWVRKWGKLFEGS